MSNIVFILGAGASKAAGAPLMAEFLDTAYELWRTGQVQAAETDFARVFRAVSDLQAVHSKATLDINNIESVFSTLEMGTMLRKFPGDDPANVGAIVDSLKLVIGTTLESTIRIPWQGGAQAPAHYGELVQLIQKLREDLRPSRSVSVITFNYDVACDFALHWRRVPVDYALSDAAHVGAVPLLKLHGSLNWVYCPDLDRVVPWTMHEYFGTYNWNVWGDEPQFVKLQFMPHLGEYKYEDHDVIPEPVLVPPTWNKAEYHKNLSDVWSRAAHELTDAEHIFIVGYSLPETDSFFRYLYALGTAGGAPLKRIWVFNPDPGVEGRFRGMLGPGATSRYRFFPQTFDQALSIINNEFRVS